MNNYWHKSFWFTRPQLNFASPANAAVGADGGGGAGTGGGAAAPSGGGGGTTSTGAPAAPPPSPTINWDTAPAQFRESFAAQKRAFEELQGKYSPYEKLGNVQDITRVQAQHTAAMTATKSIVTALNQAAGSELVSEQDLANNINQYGLIPTLNALQDWLNEVEQANAGDQATIDRQSLQQQIEDQVNQATEPMRTAHNQRLVTEGNALVERTITDLATDTLKKMGLDWAGMDNNYKQFVLTGVTEALKYDNAGMQAVKFQGAVAPIQRAFQMFTQMFDAAYLARRNAEGGVRSGPAPAKGAPAPANGFKQPTFDDMINNPDVVRTSQGKAAYSS